MAGQRQPFRFRLPWLPAPASEATPAPSRPGPTTQAPPQSAPTQRPPFRPAGVAPAQPPTRAESQPPSQPRVTFQPSGQIQGPKPSQSPQASPTRAAPKPKVSAISLPKPSEATSKVQPEAKSPALTTNQKFKIQRPDPKGPTELATRVPTPEPEAYQTTSEGRSRITRGMNQDELEEKKVIDSGSSPLTSKPKEHPVAIREEQVQHPSEEVFERKVVTETFGNSRHHTVPDIGTNEVGKFPHKPALHRDMKEGSQRLLHKHSARGDKHSTQEKPLSIITLTGENTGATMHLSSVPGKREPIHIHQRYKINPDENVDTTTDGEGGRNPGDSKLEEEFTSKLYVNNNAQGVNNSLVYNSSVTERNPGVHVVVSRNSEELIKPGKETETIRAQKAEVGSTISEKLTYAPTVRRRCLRGLFLDSSDSDPENPDKPRCHGCQVGCGQKGKDANIDFP